MNTDIIRYPVVSLRSTTGYRLRSRWDHSNFAVTDHFADVGKTIQMLKNAEKIIDDLMLTRCTCYFPVYNGCNDARGIPSCSRWLNEATPPDQNPPTLATDAGGIPSCSRWLSEATPPDLNPPESRTPAGVPAIARHAFHPHQSPLPSDLRDETPRTAPRQRVAARTPRLSRRNRQWIGCALRGRRRSGRSCPPARLAETDHLPLRFHAGAEKILVQLAPGFEMPWLPLAGRLRGLHRQCFRAALSPRLHCQSGGTPPGEIVPRGVDRFSGKIRGHLRSAISRLIPPPMASLRDTLAVSSDDPVVSLRSTTGYRMRCLRHHESRFDPSRIGACRMRCLRHHESRFDPSRIGACRMRRLRHHGSQFDPSGNGACRMRRLRHHGSQFDPSGIVACRIRCLRHHGSRLDPSGIGACSRWLSEATPPDLNPPESRTPAGVPANTRLPRRFFEHHFACVNKMVSTAHSETCAGINAEARELEAKIAENVVELLEA
jgi:hypothetical protein